MVSFDRTLLLSSPFSTEFPSIQSDPICEHLKHLNDTLGIIDRTLGREFFCSMYAISQCIEIYLEQFEVLDMDDEDFVGK